MKEPTVPFSLWIDDTIYFIDKDGHKKRIGESCDTDSYLEVKNSVYPHILRNILKSGANPLDKRSHYGLLY